MGLAGGVTLPSGHVTYNISVESSVRYSVARPGRWSSGVEYVVMLSAVAVSSIGVDRCRGVPGCTRRDWQGCLGGFRNANDLGPVGFCFGWSDDEGMMTMIPSSSDDDDELHLRK